MTAERPNLLFVLADQLGLNHCGYAGNPVARTPNLDRFAAESTDFAACVASMPVCAAYRASLWTGKYTTSTGMVINELRLNPDHECLGHVLTRGGYETAYIGKWHLWANELGNHFDPRNSFTPRGPYRLGFDGYWAAYNFHHLYYNTYYHTESPEKIGYGEGGYEPDGQTDLAIERLGALSQGDKPFAAVVSYGTPHDPWTAANVPPEEVLPFADVEFPNPPNYEPENDPYADRGWAVFRGPAEREKLPSWRRHYYAMVANLDRNFGRLLAALDRLDLSRNTVVVFSSDHGEMFGAHGRRAKNIFYDEAARIPFLIRQPGRIPAGVTTDVPISNVDMMPTLLGLLGLPVPEAAEGMDLSHCALGVPGPEPEAAFLQNTGACAKWEDGYEWRALRDRRHTYAVYRTDGRELLFDNLRDPYQTRNLADDPGSVGDLGRFRALLKHKMESLNDTFEPSSFYRERWIDDDRCIVASARGPFRPLPPV